MLSYNEAVQECQLLWKEIEKAGKSKRAFLLSPEGMGWLAKKYQGNCPLCQYTDGDCSPCPLMVQYGEHCDSLGFSVHGQSSPEFFTAIRGLKLKEGE